MKIKNKYKNIKINGSDSKIEIFRFIELQQLEKEGKIINISKQPQFILQAGFRYKNERKYPCMKYTADFQYFDVVKNKIIVEELKSKYTSKLTDYRLRSRLFKYSIKDRDDIEFVEIIR